MQKISNGGTLSAKEVEIFQAFTRDQEDLAKARHAALLHKWCAGRYLTLEEKAEIAHILPETVANRHPSLSSRKEFKEKYEVYAERYGYDVRSIKRWVRTGKEAKKPESPPLDQPELLALWWAKHMHNAVPAKLAALAAAISPMDRSSPATPQAVDPDSIGADTPPLPPSDPINLSDIDSTSSGLASGQAARLVAAAYQKLAAAYASGDDSQIPMWQTRWEKAQEALRKATVSDVEIAKANGDLIPRREVIVEISNLLEALKVMRDTMAKRLLLRLPEMPEPFRGPLAAAIEAERKKEDSLFRDLKSLKSPAHVEELLAA